MNNSATEIIEIIKNSKSPILCVDSRPDFDAFCSAVIFSDFIKNTLNKSLRVTFDSKIPDSIYNIISAYADLSFIEQNICPATDIDFSSYDLQIFLDSGNLGHICREDKFISPVSLKKLNIDHHAGNPFYGDFNYVKKRASTCTILFEFFSDAQISINTSLSTLFFLGLLTDSGFFQYDTVSPEDFFMAGELKKLGAKSDEVIWKLTFNERLVNMQFMGLVYSKFVYLPDQNVAYCAITQAEIKERGIDMRQVTRAASDMLKTLEKVSFVFVVREDEQEAEKYHISFRSHDLDFDVLPLAAHFGGGGHKRAAGGSIIAKTPQEAVNTILLAAKALSI